MKSLLGSALPEAFRRRGTNWAGTRKAVLCVAGAAGLLLTESWPALADNLPPRSKPERPSIKLHLPARSEGGQLRSGPGMKFAPIGSLPSGMPITLETNTGIRFNGYDWFMISSREQGGYQWGGVICSEGRLVEGVLKQCETPAQPNAGRDEPESIALGLPAHSRGGVVRSGPGWEYSRIGSLADGTPIVLERNTGVRVNGYDWFEIRSGRVRGYQWGGIICSEGRLLEGVLEPCPRSAGDNADGQSEPGATNAGLRLRARSAGGRVRGGPGMQYAPTGSLAEGVPIMLERNTGVRFNGYDWFEISGGGMRGYHWGGLICSEGRLLEGVLEQCGMPRR